MNDKKTTENYTEAQVKRLQEVYDPKASETERKEQLQELSAEFGKNVASIRAKLVHLKLYVKNEYKKRTGEKPETKETIVSQIAEVLGVDADASLSGLEKATKNCLILLRGTIQAEVEATEENEAS